jgi:hypothetical protein
MYIVGFVPNHDSSLTEFRASCLRRYDQNMQLIALILIQDVSLVSTSPLFQVIIDYSTGQSIIHPTSS